MSGSPGFQLIPLKEIGAAEWNRLLERSSDPRIYDTYHFLSLLCDDVWVLSGAGSDFLRFALPIPLRRKTGITYAYTPAFIQRVSLLGNIHAEEQTKLLPDLQSRIRYGTLAASLNFSPLQKTVVTQKKNFFLPLKQPADSLFSRFREDTKSRIRKAADHHLTYSTNQSDAHTDLSKIIHLYSAHLKYKRTALAPAALHKLLHFCALFPQSWIIRKVLHKQEQLMAAALLLRTDTRLYNLINITVPEGRALCANHFLLWKMMEEFSPSDSDASDAKTDNALVFDFEGSSLPGVAEFYKGFNPHEEAYWLYHYNHLPFPFSWL